MGPFPFNHLCQYLRSDRFNIRAVGHFRVGHDGCRVTVYEHDLVAFFHQGLACLGSRIIKLARLTYDYRAGTDNEDLVYV